MAPPVFRRGSFCLKRNGMLKTGSLLDGKYRIIREIGRGGMSVVYLAVNERVGKIWALKEVRKEADGRDGIREMSLAAEIGVLKKLHHPNLPDIIDIIDCSDSYVIVMDYIEGKSLKQIIGQFGPQNERLVIAWGKQICQVLDYLHSQNPPIIYRDMKPGNIILRPDGQVTLIDFGTAREYKHENQGDTTWLGTRGYAAPEQFGGNRQTDPSTDIYSLGATMYHLLTGYSPADTQFVIWPIGRFRQDLSGSRLEKIIEKCCQPEPVCRYRNCKDLLDALEHVNDKPDTEKRISRKYRRILMTGFFIMLTGMAAAAGLTAYGARSVRNEYLSCISRAEKAEDLTEASEWYKKAIRLRPDAEMAYERMLSDMTADGEITQEEKIRMDESLHDVQDTGRETISNQVVFQKANPKGYAVFLFHLGRDYYIFYPNGQREANGYLKQILEDPYLPQEDRKAAQSLIAITDYYIYAGDSADGHTWAEADAKDTFSYRRLWNLMEEIGSNPELVDEQSGGQLFSLAVYREIATRIVTDLPSLLDAGVTKEEMENALLSVGEYLSANAELKQMISSQKLYEETENVLLNAQNEMAAYYHVTGYRQEEEIRVNGPG